MRTCKSCGATFLRGETVCTYCGTPLVEGAQKERQKGWDKTRRKEQRAKEPWEGDPWWKQSGDPQQKQEPGSRWDPPHFGPPPPPPLKMFQQKSNLLAGALAIVLGTFGAHWFYMGRPRRAVKYIIFCWTGIPTIMSIVEGIGFLIKGAHDEFTKLP